MLKAVEDHERVHEVKIAPALKTDTTYRGIENLFEVKGELGVGFSYKTRSAAITALQNSDIFGYILDEATGIGDDTYRELIKNDHGDISAILDDGVVGPAYQAELNATSPMRNSITDYAAAQGWNEND